MNYKISENFIDFKDTLQHYILNFEKEGESYGNQKRNSLRLFDLKGKYINIKSFKVPHLFNQFVYRFFRKSKAQRSYEYAKKLVKLGIGTPEPIAYYEFTTPFLFKNSFYVSEQLSCDYTYRDLTKNFDIKNYEQILRAFTRFTYRLHENGILFLDHSPGNTLIKIQEDGSINFYLVDLNRMKFGSLDFKTRIKNFERLTVHKSMVKIMSSEYAKCIDEPYEKVFDLMWHYTETFQERYHRRKRIKKKLKFWKT